MHKRGILREFLSVFFPTRCPYCREVIRDDAPLCADCRETLVLQREPVEVSRSPDGRPVICIAPFVYRDTVKAALMRFKFGDRPGLAESFGRSMAEQVVKAAGDDSFDLITSVPLSRKRQKERGYNQAELLARRVAECLHGEYQDLLVKYKHNEAQHTLGREARRQNVEGVYRIEPSVPLRGKRILLCDDIVTTGSTLAECSRLLYEAGAGEVWCVTLAAAK